MVVDVKTYGMEDIVTSSNGQEIKSAKSWGLFHSGDFVVIEPAKTPGIGSVIISVVRIQEEAHHETGLGFIDRITDQGTRTYNETYTIKSGQSKKILNKEAYKTQRPNTTAEYDWIGNCDTTVTITRVLDPTGKDMEITAATDPNVMFVVWVLYDLDGKEVARGDAKKIEDAKGAAKAKATDLKMSYYSYKVFDEGGNEVFMDNVQPPPGSDFPWWIVGVAVAAAVAIVVVWYFYRRRVSIPGPAAPAAPVAAPSSVVVVK